MNQIITIHFPDNFFKDFKKKEVLNYVLSIIDENDFKDLPLFCWCINDECHMISYKGVISEYKIECIENLSDAITIESNSSSSSFSMLYWLITRVWIFRLFVEYRVFKREGEKLKLIPLRLGFWRSLKILSR